MPATSRWSRTRLADRARRRRRAQPLEHRLVVGRVAEDVRAEPADRRVRPRELQHRAVPEHRLVLGAAEDEPRPARRAGAARLHAPAAGHPQVAAEDEPALEAEQEVLPHRLDRTRAEARSAARPAASRCPRMRRLDLDGLPDEHLEPLCGAMERIAFRHSGKPTIADMTRALHRRPLVARGGVRARRGRLDRHRRLPVLDAVGERVPRPGAELARDERARRGRAGRRRAANGALAPRLHVLAQRLSPRPARLRRGREARRERAGAVAHRERAAAAASAHSVRARGTGHGDSTSNGGIVVVGDPAAVAAARRARRAEQPAPARRRGDRHRQRRGAPRGRDRGRDRRRRRAPARAADRAAPAPPVRIAAEALALGDFETPLRYRFRDEFGALAYNFDRMRRQLRRSFRRIEAERDRLRLLLERLHEGVVTVDEDLVVHFANAEARRLLGGRLRRGRHAAGAVGGHRRCASSSSGSSSRTRRRSSSTSPRARSGRSASSGSRRRPRGRRR